MINGDDDGRFLVIFEIKMSYFYLRLEPGSGTCGFCFVGGLSTTKHVRHICLYAVFI